MAFFDRMGIKFQYEPQGYKLPDGTCYLPDFYLPVINTWAEVKPVPLSPEERRKCEAVVMGLGGCFLFLVGPPAFDDYWAVCRDSGAITECCLDLDIHASNRRYYEQEHRFWCRDDLSSPRAFSPEYRHAVASAIAERFDGSVYRPPDDEPFNPDPEDLLRAWGLL
jgi:hypothetical protein